MIILWNIFLRFLLASDVVSKLILVSDKIHLFQSLTWMFSHVQTCLGGDIGLRVQNLILNDISQRSRVDRTRISKAEDALGIKLILWVFLLLRGELLSHEFFMYSKKEKVHHLHFFYFYLNSATGVFYLKLYSSRDFTVNESYYAYLLTSLNYRSDLVRIFSIFQQFLMKLFMNKML